MRVIGVIEPVKVDFFATIIPIKSWHESGAVGVEYISVREAAERWGISERRVRLLCSLGKVEGVVRHGRAYRIPASAPRPQDGGRTRRFSISEQYREIFSRIDAMKAELDARRPFSAAELRRMREEFAVEYTYNSNAIEGNTLTLRETALVLEGLTIDKKPLKDHLEAVGHKEAFDYVLSLVLMDRPEERGRWRRIPVRILGASSTPPEPETIPELMERLVADERRSRLHPIERAALFHLKFENIHPFVDGNGRTGRLILNLSLMKNGYPPVNVKFADRRRYYDAFESWPCDGGGAMTRLVAEYIEEELAKLLRFAAQ